MDARALTYAHSDRPALANVSASFAPGQLSVILGPNGAGKSTLLGCLAGLLRPDSGSATIGDAVVTDMPGKIRARAVGVLPQSSETHWAVSAEALVALGRHPHQRGWGITPADRAAINAARKQPKPPGLPPAR